MSLLSRSFLSIAIAATFFFSSNAFGVTYNVPGDSLDPLLGSGPLGGSDVIHVPERTKVNLSDDSYKDEVWRVGVMEGGSDNSAELIVMSGGRLTGNGNFDDDLQSFDVLLLQDAYLQVSEGGEVGVSCLSRKWNFSGCALV